MGVWDELREIFPDPDDPTQLVIVEGKDYSVWIAPPTAKQAVKHRIMLRRRARVNALLLIGKTEAEIAQTLGVPEGTIASDARALKQQWADQGLIAAGVKASQNMARLEAMLSRAFELSINGLPNERVRALDSALKIIQEMGTIMGYRQSGVLVDVTAHIRKLAEAQGFDPNEAEEIAMRVSVALR